MATLETTLRPTAAPAADPRGWYVHLAGVAVLTGLAVYLAAQLAYALMVRGVVTVWIPSGVTLGLLLSRHRREWLAIALGALLGNLAIDTARAGVTAIAFLGPVANVTESIVAAFVVRRLAGPGDVLASVRGIAALVIGGAVASNGVTAILGGALFHVWYHHTWLEGWFNWWIGDGLAMIVVAPALLGLVAGIRRVRRGPVAWALFAEGTVLAGVLLAIAVTVFVRPAAPGRIITTSFLVFPVLMWMALRIGPGAAASTVCLLAGVALWNTSLGRGPLVEAGSSPLEQAAMVYAFLGLASLSVLVPAAAIHEREDAAERVRGSEGRYRALVDTAQDAIITVTANGRVQFANAAVRDVLGHDPAALLGRSVMELIPEADQAMLREAFARYVTGEDPRPWRGVALTGLHRDGREIPVEFAFGEWSADGVRYFTGIVRDITERTRLEEALRQSQKLEALGRLTGGVAHEFRNELTVILGNAELAILEAPPDGPQRAALEEIRSAAARGSALTQELLAFGRRQHLRPAVLDLGEAVERGIAAMRPVLGTETVVERAGTDGRVLVRADPTALQQVLMNLMINAHDAMPDGGRLSLRTANAAVEAAQAARLDLPGPGRFGVLEIADTGSGMDAATLAQIFEPFFTTKPRGTGLGLAAVYGIVKQSGGAIQVESVPGAGTTFRIHLPAAAGPVSSEA